MLSVNKEAIAGNTDLNRGLGYSSPVFKRMLEENLWFTRSLGRGEMVGLTTQEAQIPSIVQGHILTLHSAPRVQVGNCKSIRGKDKHRE